MSQNMNVCKMAVQYVQCVDDSVWPHSPGFQHSKEDITACMYLPANT